MQIYLFSYSFVGQQSDMGLTWAKIRVWAGLPSFLEWEVGVEMAFLVNAGSRFHFPNCQLKAILIFQGLPALLGSWCTSLQSQEWQVKLLSCLKSILLLLSYC